jgi:DNA-binding response OmpR family regulator
MNTATKKVLIVEDDPRMRELIAEIIEREGYAVQTAKDGDIGWQLLEKSDQIDLVITDIFMPKKEGVGLIRAIRRQFPHIKIIAITAAVNFDEISATAHDFGANLTIHKPFDVEEFSEKVKQLISTADR